MSILINIENYEAFYLDYLEGNLDEGQTSALLLFLEQHPELKIEEELPAFGQEEGALLDPAFLAGLKMFDVTETINESNYEQFMIASLEQQLPATKQVELNDFMGRREQMQAEMAFYRQTKLEADLTLVYPHKAHLKRGTVIPMYVRFAAAAASIILVLMLIPWNTTSSEQVLPAQLASLDVDVEVQAGQKSANPVQKQVKELNPAQAGISENIQPVENTEQRPEIERIASLRTRKAQHLGSNPEKELMALQLTKADEKEKTEDTDPYLALSDMKNPVSFLTKGIKSRFHQDVDVRMAKASKTRQGGFYLKIGKFEFSRKTAPVNEEVLASY